MSPFRPPIPAPNVQPLSKRSGTPPVLVRKESVEIAAEPPTEEGEGVVRREDVGYTSEAERCANCEHFADGACLKHGFECEPGGHCGDFEEPASRYEPEEEDDDGYDDASDAGAVIEEPHEFCSTQCQMPQDVARMVVEAAARISDEDLAEDGREDDPHVTVLFGLHDEDPGAVEELIGGEPPVVARLGKISKFPEKDGRGFEVIKFDVDSEDLHRLNGKLRQLPHTNKFPDYEPHVTLAYVKPGSADKYLGKHSLTGKRFIMDRVMFSNKTREKTPIMLRGKRR